MIPSFIFENIRISTVLMYLVFRVEFVKVSKILLGSELRGSSLVGSGQARPLMWIDLHYELRICTVGL